MIILGRYRYKSTASEPVCQRRGHTGFQLNCTRIDRVNSFGNFLSRARCTIPAGFHSVRTARRVLSRSPSATAQNYSFIVSGKTPVRMHQRRTRKTPRNSRPINFPLQGRSRVKTSATSRTQLHPRRSVRFQNRSSPACQLASAMKKR